MTVRLQKNQGRLFLQTTRALAHKNFRLFFFGQLVSLIGTWISNVSTSWLVYRLTGSAVLLGVVSFASQFPAFLVSPFAGVHIDRLNKRRVLIITQALSAIQSFALAVLTLSGTITVSQLIFLSVAQALVDGFFIPARQAFLSELLDKKSDLANAIALNSASFHLARLIGPAIGGILIAMVGEGWCFGIDAISYSAVLLSLFSIRVTVKVKANSSSSIMDELREGISYIRSHQMVRILLSHMAFFCLLGIAHSVLLPVLVKDVYFKGPEDLGLLIGASGFGALMGAIYLATRSSVSLLFPTIKRSGFAFGVGLITLSLSRNETLSMIVLSFCGFFFLQIGAGSNTIIQTTVEDKFRGRVMSFFAMTFSGMMPLGAIASGYLAESFGAPVTILLSGIFCLVGSSALLLSAPSLTPNVSTH